LFSRDSNVFEEGLERPDYAVGEYNDEKDFQWVSCIEEIKPVAKST
jgi:hypothetical protein